MTITRFRDRAFPIRGIVAPRMVMKFIPQWAWLVSRKALAFAAGDRRGSAVISRSGARGARGRPLVLRRWKVNATGRPVVLRSNDRRSGVVIGLLFLLLPAGCAGLARLPAGAAGLSGKNAQGDAVERRRLGDPGVKTVLRVPATPLLHVGSDPIRLFDDRGRIVTVWKDSLPRCPFERLSVVHTESERSSGAAQREFLARVIEAGGRYVVAYAEADRTVLVSSKKRTDGGFGGPEKAQTSSRRVWACSGTIVRFIPSGPDAPSENDCEPDP
jgi:hypothetical protein